MLKYIMGAAGLGVLGFDLFTAFYLLSLCLHGEKRANLGVFMLTFVLGSLLPGAALSSTLGSAAVDWIKSVIPEDNSPFWAAAELVIALAIASWAIRKARAQNNVKEREKEERGSGGSTLKCFAVGAVFAAAAFTDPTYYAAMLLGGETKSFGLALLVLSIWLGVSQCMAFVVCFANRLNLLHRLTVAVDKLKSGKFQKAKNVFYAAMAAAAALLLADSGLYMLAGEYLF